MLAETSGAMPLAGTSAVSGGLAGVVLGEETGAGNRIGEGPFVDGLWVGATMGVGGLAGDFSGAMEGDLTGEVDGDFAGEMDGDFAGGFETGAGLAGVYVGGDTVGDFEGDAGEMEGEDA